MTISVFVGPSGAGKTTEILKLLNRTSGRASLYLSSDPFLSNRPNVKPGGFMGCRTLGLKFPITDVVSSDGLARALDNSAMGDLVAFDEAQYFPAEVIQNVIAASERGVDIVVGMPSHDQLEKLNAAGAAVISPAHTADISRFRDMLRDNAPFPGEDHAYQPFYGLNFDDFIYVRQDCPERLRLMLHAARKALNFTGDAPDSLSYLDVGCCSGFFVEGMAASGFKSTGVDVQKIYVEMGRSLSEFRASGTTYLQQNAYDFSKGDEHFDVISSFATIQWVMTQRGYAEGLETLVNLMNRADKVFVLEMGYTSEDVYKGKIDVEIDRGWTDAVLRKEGGFKHVTRHDAGQSGLWRDMFVAVR